MTDEYWILCVESALEDAGLSATTEQVCTMAAVIEGAHETYGEATGRDVADRNWSHHAMGEIESLKGQLASEKEKRDCTTCHGTGREKYNAGPWAVNAHCSTCNGEGRVKP